MPGIGPIVVSTGAAASDRRTFRELKDELARGYNAGDETTLSIAGDSINAAIRDTANRSDKPDGGFGDNSPYWHNWIEQLEELIP